LQTLEPARLVVPTTYAATIKTLRQVETDDFLLDNSERGHYSETLLRDSVTLQWAMLAHVSRGTRRGLRTLR